MNYFTVFCGALIPILLLLNSNAQAGEITSNHTLPSGPDVYRVEVRNLTRFEVMEPGDSDGTGELHRLNIELRAGDQFHKKTERATPGFLHNATTNDGGNTSYLNVRKGNHVLLYGRANHDNLWIHTKAVTKFGDRQIISLNTYARELDCAGKRVCRRGGTGGFTISFNIPNFATPPSNRCGPQNTFQLVPVDGELTITGVDNVQDRNFQVGDHRGRFRLLLDHKSGGVVLRPFNAEICIASTTRPGTRPTPPPPSNERFAFLKNVASNRCLTIPRDGMSSASVPAQVNRCHFEASIGPHREKWQLVGTAHSTYFIRSSEGNHCLNLKTATDNREGGPVKIVNCSGHNDQKWYRSGSSNGQFSLKHLPSQKCLNVHGREHKDYGQISVYTCAETPDQRWTFIDEHRANDIAALERRR